MSIDPVIEPRFRGPPDSGNGGYCAGIAASYVDGPARVTLRKPPPLDSRLTVERDGEHVRFSHEGELIIEAEPAEPAVDPPAPPGFEEALALEPHPSLYEHHVFPECFVCGPARAKGDGLRILPGPHPGGGFLAAGWVPDDSLRYRDGLVGRPFLWAALDCPSGWAAMTNSQAAGTPMVLGRITARIARNAVVDEPLVVMAWPIGAEGRKHHAGSAIVAEGGEVIAVAEATWITLAA